MWRGLEVILRAAIRATPGPSSSASAASARHARADLGAVEDALGIPDPQENANRSARPHAADAAGARPPRALYHLHALDWVNLVNALKADPKATSEIAEDLRVAAVESRLFRDICRPG